MIYLKNSLAAWNKKNFDAVFTSELAALGLQHLPLQKALAFSSYALDNNISARLINKTENENFIQIKTGIFYTGIIAGCNCADDPSPTDEQNEYCELLVNIHKKNAEASIALL